MRLAKIIAHYPRRDVSWWPSVKEGRRKRPHEGPSEKVCEEGKGGFGIKKKVADTIMRSTSTGMKLNREIVARKRKEQTNNRRWGVGLRAQMRKRKKIKQNKKGKD